MAIKVGLDEMRGYLDEVFPQVRGMFEIEKLDESGVTVRLLNDEKHLRPGGTVSGPAMFSLADYAAYIATMALIGRQALAVTTNCSIDFMRKPAAGVDLLAHAEVLKLGRALSVCDVRLHSVGMDAPVARATLTYSIPPAR